MFEWKKSGISFVFGFYFNGFKQTKNVNDVGGSCKFCICQLRMDARVHFCFCSNLLDICQLKNHQFRLIFAAIIPNHSSYYSEVLGEMLGGWRATRLHPIIDTYTGYQKAVVDRFTRNPHSNCLFT